MAKPARMVRTQACKNIQCIDLQFNSIPTPIGISGVRYPTGRPSADFNALPEAIED